MHGKTLIMTSFLVPIPLLTCRCLYTNKYGLATTPTDSSRVGITRHPCLLLPHVSKTVAFYKVLGLHLP
jgi:hypothetical protein